LLFMCRWNSLPMGCEVKSAVMLLKKWKWKLEAELICENHSTRLNLLLSSCPNELTFFLSIRVFPKVTLSLGQCWAVLTSVFSPVFTLRIDGNWIYW
jgi:hypothetical protein